MLEPDTVFACPSVYDDGVMIRERNSARIGAMFGASIVILKLEIVIKEDAVEDQEIVRLVA